VLDHIQQHSIRRQKVNWTALRRDVLAKAAGARTTADTYPAIRLALQRLQDHHSFLLTPGQLKELNAGRSSGGLGMTVIYPESVVVEVFAGSPAARAGVHVGDTLLKSEAEAIGPSAKGPGRPPCSA
jgi:C-terminal processing protease CtpA/Prc